MTLRHCGVGFLGLLLAVAANAQPRRPVLVELFTSEGCSSCPPADALLQELEKSQPVAGAQIVVLSEHVDYWDGPGWRDRFSSPLFTARQTAYGKRFRLDSVYTPEMVVNGNQEVLGNDRDAAVHAVEAAGHTESVPVKLTMQPDGRAHLEVDALPASFKHGEANVFLAVADSEATTEVHGGENKGRTLHHVAVLRSLTSVGKVSTKGGFSTDLHLGELKLGEHGRLIAFVQEAKQGPILGSVMLGAL